MNFFQAQEEARRRTKWLVVYFAMAVIAIIVSAYIGVAGSIALIAPRQQHFEFNPFLWNGNLFAIVGIWEVRMLDGDSGIGCLKILYQLINRFHSACIGVLPILDLDGLNPVSYTHLRAHET